MTNGDKIRSLGDMDLLNMIRLNFKDKCKCSVCSVGIDKNGYCKDNEKDCEEGIYEWLGNECNTKDKRGLFTQ